jgi:hypothetical protein
MKVSYKRIPLLHEEDPHIVLEEDAVSAQGD